MLSQQLVHAYVEPFVQRPPGLNFANKTLVASLALEEAFSVYSYDPNNPATKQPGAYSIQINVGAARHWYQNTFIQNKVGGLVWHLECFEATSISASGYVALPLTGQFFRTTDPAGLPPSGNPFGLQIPATIDLRQGGYLLMLYHQDDGVNIKLAAEIRSLTPSAAPFPVLWHSGWATVADAFTQPDQPGVASGHWYDPAIRASGGLCGVGGGMKGQFTGGDPLLVFDTGSFRSPTLVLGGTPDLVAGGQYWGTDGVPYEDPVADAAGATAEKSNYVWPLLDRNADASTPPPNGRLLKVNGHTGTVVVAEGGRLDWEFSGLDDDIGGDTQFGFIPHGVDPAPPGAGYYEADRQKVDATATARGSVTLYLGGLMKDGAVIDAYGYDAATGDKTGYSQGVVVMVDDSLVFQGTPT